MLKNYFSYLHIQPIESIMNVHDILSQETEQSVYSHLNPICSSSDISMEDIPPSEQPPNPPTHPKKISGGTRIKTESYS